MSVNTWMDVLVKPGMTCVDVGANMGSVTRRMLTLVKETGRVIAIEPDEKPYRSGKEQYPAADWHQVALGDHEGLVPLHLGHSREHNSLWEANVIGPHGPLMVTMTTLDALVPGRVDLVKVDAQGAECAVLAGAQRHLAQQTTWVLEVWSSGLQHAGASVSQLCQQLDAAGLEAGVLRGPDFELWDWARVRQEAERLSRHSAIDIIARPKSGVN